MQHHSVIVRAIVSEDAARIARENRATLETLLPHALAATLGHIRVNALEPARLEIIDPAPDRAAGARAACQATAESLAEMVAATCVDYDRLEELRAKREAGCYSVGWNMPGFMPDSEPFRVDTCDEARDALADELERFANDEESDAAAGPLLEARDALREMIGDPDADWGQTIGQYHYWLAHIPGELADNEEREELEELEAAAGDCESEDDAWQRVDEDPLSVEVRTGWHAPGETGEPEEFCILLCTGGPAVRIRGELDAGEPSRAWLEYQDWGTPWAEYHGPGVDSDALLTYCGRFFSF